jgi:hypothetical protein
MFQHGNASVQYSVDGKDVVIKVDGELMTMTGAEAADLFKCLSDLATEATKNAVAAGLVTISDPILQRTQKVARELAERDMVDLDVIVGKKILDPSLNSKVEVERDDPDHVTEQLQIIGDCEMTTRLLKMLVAAGQGVYVPKISVWHMEGLKGHGHPCFAWYDGARCELVLESARPNGRWESVRDRNAPARVGDSGAYYRTYMKSMLELLEDRLFFESGGG